MNTENTARTGVRAMLVGNSVVLRIEDGNPDLEELPIITLTPAKALKLSFVLVRYAWRAASHAQRSRGAADV